MKTFKIDLDYENFLFDKDYIEDSPQNLKIIKEFEYIFFIINTDSKAKLKNYKNYSNNYLKHLTSLGFIIPQFDPMAFEINYFWGSRKDIELENILNSKITSATLAKANNWGFYNGSIVKSYDEVKSHIQQYSQTNWLLKSPHSFSGIGHFKFSKHDYNESALMEKLNQGPVLLEPVYDRVFDIGTTFIIEAGEIKRKFMVENSNSITGRFRGGVGRSSIASFKKYILKKYHYNLDELDTITDVIAREYLKLGAQSNIQIDSFVYLENDQLKLYALVEVNYRKTMGLVIQSLIDRFNLNDEQILLWNIYNKKELKEIKLDTDWTCLSPEDNNLSSFFKIISLI